MSEYETATKAFNKGRSPRPEDKRARQEKHVEIKAWNESLNGRTRLSNLQENIFKQINQILPEDSKELAEFNHQYLDVVDLQDKLTAAQKSRKNLFEAYLLFNRALYNLAGVEVGILKSIEAGYLDAWEAENAQVREKLNQKREIEQEFAAAINVPHVASMPKEIKAKFTEDRKAAKAKMIKDIQDLEITSASSQAQLLRVDHSRIKLNRKAISAWCDVYYPVPTDGPRLSVLEMNNIVSNMIAEKSKIQAGVTD